MSPIGFLFIIWRPLQSSPWACPGPCSSTSPSAGTSNWISSLLSFYHSLTWNHRWSPCWLALLNIFQGLGWLLFRPLLGLALLLLAAAPYVVPFYRFTLVPCQFQFHTCPPLHNSSAGWWWTGEESRIVRDLKLSFKDVKDTWKKHPSRWDSCKIIHTSKRWWTALLWSNLPKNSVVLISWHEPLSCDSILV